MSKTKQLLGYYRDCYRHDSADLNLWQLGRHKAQDRYFLDGNDELGSGFLPRQPIDNEFGEQISKRIDIYQRERVLLYAALTVVGKLEINGESRPVVTPLVYCEASIENENGDYFACLDGKVQINEALVKLLLSEEISLPTELTDNPNDVGLWRRLFKEAEVNIDADSAMTYPRLATPGEIKSAQRRKGNSLIPAAMLVFVERSSASRGVLHEMQMLIEKDQLSKPLENLLGQENGKSGVIKAKGDYLPALLSHAQHKALSIAADVSLGMVSGPPGTGKSYTIAAVAAEHMARGESVLIVAHSDTALDVIGDKLTEDFDLQDVFIRAGQKAFLKRLKEQVNALLSGVIGSAHKGNNRKTEARLKKLNRQLEQQEAAFEHFCRRALARGTRLQKWQQNQNHWVSRVYLSLFSWKIQSLTTQWRILDRLNLSLEQKQVLATQYLKQCKAVNTADLLKHHRQSLQAFNQAIRSRTSKKQFAQFEAIDFDVLFGAFPIWLTSLNSLFRVLPLKQELFDLVIIDEASQSNITSALPALYRAKRALVVGDARQLRHYSFISRSLGDRLAKANGLDDNEPGLVGYRDNSLLDLVESRLPTQNHLAFLDEHFRCRPELIEFSNRQFYHNRLRIMQHRPHSTSGHLELRRVEGKRTPQGFNQQEAEAILSFVKAQQIQDEQSGQYHSIGILSPYRHQAEYIAEQLSQRFTHEVIERHRIRVATPFGFQGEERDIMLLSFCIDNDSRRAAVYLNKPDVFNVAITRAKMRQLVFLSLDTSQLAKDHLLRQYVESIGRFNAQNKTAVEQDEFQQMMADELNRLDIDTWCGFTLAGLEIDILCRVGNRYLAIDLIGYPGRWQDAFEPAQYKILKRIGVEMLPITWGLWTINPARCLEEVCRRLGVEPPGTEN